MNCSAAAKRAFKVFDRDGGGDITYMEFRDGIKNLGLPIQEDQVKQLYLETASELENNLTIEDFATSMGIKISPRPAEVPRWDKRPASASGTPSALKPAEAPLPEN